MSARDPSDLDALTWNLLTMNIIKTRCAAAALLLGAGLSLAAHADSKPSISAQWALGDASRWDYLEVEPLHHRLFISRADRVQVLDLPSGKVAGEIAHTNGVHGIAFAPDLKRGYTSNGKADSVTVFDLETLATIAEVKVTGANPDAILYDKTSHHLFTFNGKSANVTVFDAASMKVIDTIKVGGRPEFAVSDNAGKIYLNIEDKSEINVIDVASNKVVASWPLGACEEPTGIALDEAHARLFSVCQNKVMAVTDANSGKRVATLAIGEHPDAVIYDAATANVFSSDGGGTLSVLHQVDADHYVPVTQLGTLKGAKTMAMDHAGKQIYLPSVSNKVFTVLVVTP